MVTKKLSLTWPFKKTRGFVCGLAGKLMFPKIGGFYPPNHPFVHRVFHYFHHPFWGTTIFGNTQIEVSVDSIFAVIAARIGESRIAVRTSGC